MSDQKIIDRLDELEKKLGWTKEKMADALGLKKDSYYTARSAGRGFKLSTIINLVTELPDLSLNWLLKGQGPVFSNVEYIMPIGGTQYVAEEQEKYMDPVHGAAVRIEEKMDVMYQMLREIKEKIH